MNQHRFPLALCALVSSLVLADVANAATYPTYSTTTLSKGYRPIDVFFNTLVEGSNYGGGDYSTGPIVNENVLDSVTLVFEADWAVSDGFTYPSGTDSGGVAGVWVFEFDAAGLPQTQTSIDDGTLFTVSATGPGVEFGTFTYLGGFLGNLPDEDTPEPRDVFKLFTQSGGASLDVRVLNGGLDFAVALTGDLVHVGPFIACDAGNGGDDGDGGNCKCTDKDGEDGEVAKDGKVAKVGKDGKDGKDGKECECDDEIKEQSAYSSSNGTTNDFCIDGLTLDTTRNFPGCTLETLDVPDACGLVTALNATNVPEPGTLALFGLGLASLGIRFRSRRKAVHV